MKVPQHCAQKRLQALNEGIGTEKRPWSDAFPGAHLVLDLWRYADFPLLIAASEFQITSVRGRQSIWNFGHHFPQPRLWTTIGTSTCSQLSSHVVSPIQASRHANAFLILA